MNKEFYEINVAGLTRQLPLCPLNDKLTIAGFVIFGDPELTVACAAELNKLAPEHDIMITAESKGIPLIHEMARQAGESRYVLARKSVKLYMKDVKRVDVQSITTSHVRTPRCCAGAGCSSWTTSSPPGNPSAPSRSW